MPTRDLSLPTIPLRTPCDLKDIQRLFREVFGSPPPSECKSAPPRTQLMPHDAKLIIAKHRPPIWATDSALAWSPRVPAIQCHWSSHNSSVGRSHNFDSCTCKPFLLVLIPLWLLLFATLNVWTSNSTYPVPTSLSTIAHNYHIRAPIWCSQSIAVVNIPFNCRALSYLLYSLKHTHKP